MLDFTPMKSAKVRATEMARILNVHRVSVGAWIAGTKRPQNYLVSKIQKVLDALQAGVEAGDLPVPPDVKRDARAAYLEATLVKHLRAARGG